MSELNKTLLFIVAAAAAIGAAWVSKPSKIGVAPPDVIGKPLFVDFEDPDQAKQMEVVEFDEDLGELSTFEVARKSGAWVIPSHNDYPADAEENLAKAATMFVGLDVINVVSDERKDHAIYGVVRPDRDEVSLGDEGVGKLITMKDDQGRTLAELIIGKEVQGQEGQRYVRAGNVDRVYTVEIDPNAMSTEFQDWIEQDVLNLNGIDITSMTIRDYSTSPELTDRGIALNDQQRLEMKVNWNSDEFKWELDQLLELRGDRLAPTELLAAEELDKQGLDGMKNALDDLQIVDVERKPAGLGAGLRAEESFWNDDEGIRSLFGHGFYPVQMPDGETKLRSSDGEVEVQTQAGVNYLFRFGQMAGIEQDADESRINRFVMITAALDESAFEKPELELPEGAEPTAGDEGETEADAAAKADADEADVPDDADDNTDEAAEDPASPADSTDESANQASEADSPENDTRVAAVKQYEQAMDEYKEQIAQAEERVRELNYRFSDWYYVISEDEYKKIHLRRSDVITAKESAAEEGSGVDALRKLEEEGLQREETAEEVPPTP